MIDYIALNLMNMIHIISASLHQISGQVKQDDNDECVSGTRTLQLYMFCGDNDDVMNISAESCSDCYLQHMFLFHQSRTFIDHKINSFDHYLCTECQLFIPDSFDELYLLNNPTLKKLFPQKRATTLDNSCCHYITTG